MRTIYFDSVSGEYDKRTIHIDSDPEDYTYDKITCPDWVHITRNSDWTGLYVYCDDNMNDDYTDSSKREGDIKIKLETAEDEDYNGTAVDMCLAHIEQEGFSYGHLSGTSNVNITAYTENNKLYILYEILGYDIPEDSCVSVSYKNTDGETITLNIFGEIGEYEQYIGNCSDVTTFKLVEEGSWVEYDRCNIISITTDTDITIINHEDDGSHYLVLKFSDEYIYNSTEKPELTISAKTGDAWIVNGINEVTKRTYPISGPLTGIGTYVDNKTFPYSLASDYYAEKVSVSGCLMDNETITAESSYIIYKETIFSPTFSLQSGSSTSKVFNVKYNDSAFTLNVLSNYSWNIHSTNTTLTPSIGRNNANISAVCSINESSAQTVEHIISGRSIYGSNDQTDSISIIQGKAPYLFIKNAIGGDAVYVDSKEQTITGFYVNSDTDWTIACPYPNTELNISAGTGNVSSITLKIPESTERQTRTYHITGKTKEDTIVATDYIEIIQSAYTGETDTIKITYSIVQESKTRPTCAYTVTVQDTTNSSIVKVFSGLTNYGGGASTLTLSGTSDSALFDSNTYSYYFSFPLMPDYTLSIEGIQSLKYETGNGLNFTGATVTIYDAEEPTVPKINASTTGMTFSYYGSETNTQSFYISGAGYYELYISGDNSDKFRIDGLTSGTLSSSWIQVSITKTSDGEVKEDTYVICSVYESSSKTEPGTSAIVYLKANPQIPTYTATISSDYSDMTIEYMSENNGYKESVQVPAEISVTTSTTYAFIVSKMASSVAYVYVNGTLYSNKLEDITIEEDEGGGQTVTHTGKGLELPAYQNYTIELNIGGNK